MIKIFIIYYLKIIWIMSYLISFQLQKSHSFIKIKSSKKIKNVKILAFYYIKITFFKSYKLHFCIYNRDTLFKSNFDLLENLPN